MAGADSFCSPITAHFGVICNSVPLNATALWGKVALDTGTASEGTSASLVFLQGSAGEGRAAWLPAGLGFSRVPSLPPSLLLLLELGLSGVHPLL